MQQLANDPIFQAYSATAIALAMNLLLLGNGSAVSRARAGEVINPEDKEKLNKEAVVVFEEGNAKTARYRRAHRNALENIPVFLLTALALTFTTVPATVAYALFAVFVVARLLHSGCYVVGVQPWRTAAFALGALAQVVLLGCLGYYALV